MILELEITEGILNPAKYYVKDFFISPQCSRVMKVIHKTLFSSSPNSNNESF